MIKNHLRKGKKITALMALNKYGCLRLAARINDLRMNGEKIKTNMVYKNHKTFAEYYI
ncbi:MAG TPA: helix-turn-helix domain-containing protein [Bacteroidia bacterium]|nr:helix-turn-helix domain-containing protein [Bacteroidia bacterium]